MPFEVFYPDQRTIVQLGDLVETRVWWRRKVGRVIYFPGVSPINRQMERDGLRWVGIRLEGGHLLCSVVDPKGGFLRNRVQLIARSSEPVELLDPNVDLDDNDTFVSP